MAGQVLLQTGARYHQGLIGFAATGIAAGIGAWVDEEAEEKEDRLIGACGRAFANNLNVVCNATVGAIASVTQQQIEWLDKCIEDANFGPLILQSLAIAVPTVLGAGTIYVICRVWNASRAGADGAHQPLRELGAGQSYSSTGANPL